MFSEVESRETLFKSPTAQMSVNFVTLWSFVSDIIYIILFSNLARLHVLTDFYSAL